MVVAVHTCILGTTRGAREGKRKASREEVSKLTGLLAPAQTARHTWRGLASVRAEQAYCGTSPPPTPTAMSWAARPVRGRRVGNTYLEHRFSAFSALLAHGRFGEVRTSPCYTAALAQQYLRYRAGLHLLHREVETAVWRM